MIILASQSPRRQELMKLTGLPFTVRVADVDETMDKSLPVQQEVTRVSRFSPPSSTAPSSAAVASPVAAGRTPNDPESPCAIELHWLMLPTPNDASIQNSANAPARKPLPTPFFR